MNKFFKHPFFTNKKYVLTIWLVITIISAVKQFLIDEYGLSILGEIPRFDVEKIDVFLEILTYWDAKQIDFFK